MGQGDSDRGKHAQRHPGKRTGSVGAVGRLVALGKGGHE